MRSSNIIIIIIIIIIKRTAVINCPLVSDDLVCSSVLPMLRFDDVSKFRYLAYTLSATSAIISHSSTAVVEDLTLTSGCSHTIKVTLSRDFTVP